MIILVACCYNNGIILFRIPWLPEIGAHASNQNFVERRGRMVRTSDFQPEGRGFESRRRHGVASLSRIP
jgi:hypothetical protein